MKEKKTDHKKDHYVTKSHLRHFSNDGKRILLYNIKEGILHSTSITNTAQKKDFYGKGDSIENLFHPLEGDIEKIHKKIIATSSMCSLAEKEKMQFLVGLLLQRGRTVKAEDKSKEMVAGLTEHVFIPQLLRHARQKKIELSEKMLEGIRFSKKKHG